METDPKNIVVEPGTIWRVERSEDTETIRDSANNIRYQGRRSMTATHLAMALRDNDNLRQLLGRIYNHLAGILSADDPLRAEISRALYGVYGGRYQKMEIPPVAKETR